MLAASRLSGSDRHLRLEFFEGERFNPVASTDKRTARPTVYSRFMIRSPSVEACGARL
jgi:hypothetical protein